MSRGSGKFKVQVDIPCCPRSEGVLPGVAIGGLLHGAGGLSVGRAGGCPFYTRGMRPICFLSDFGLADDFVGTCKGVMLSVAPGLSVIDLTHDVPGFEIEAGAEILENATRYMPGGAIYLAGVAPRGGAARRALALRTRGGPHLVGAVQLGRRS